MEKLGVYFLVITSMIIFTSCAAKKVQEKPEIERQAKAFIDNYLKEYVPLHMDQLNYWFKSATEGKEEYSKKYEEAELGLRLLNNNIENFLALKNYYNNISLIKDRAIKRNVEVLYFDHLVNQVPKDLLKKFTALEKKCIKTFNDYSPVLDGKKVTNSDLSKILSESMDSAELENAWKASKIRGKDIEKDYIELIKIRNEIAKSLGYKNYAYLSADILGISIKELDRFYEDIYEATKEQFKYVKEEFIDVNLAKHYGITKSELRPWHYKNPYFQAVPSSVFQGVDLDEYYKDKTSEDVIKLVVDFYASIGLDAEPSLERSSLYPAEGKSPHAAAWYLDPRKPSSVLYMNLPKAPKYPSAEDALTLVHELVHDFDYDASLASDEVPLNMKEGKGQIAEAFAMLFEKQTVTKSWLKRIGATDEEIAKIQETSKLSDYIDQLVFLRWCSVMYYFERLLYENPNQNINNLWWQLKKKYQLLDKPKGWTNPDALAKYHTVTYNKVALEYSEYALGYIINVSLGTAIANKLGIDIKENDYYGQKKLGPVLNKEFLTDENLFPWKEYVEVKTGSKFSIKPWIEYYIKPEYHKQLPVIK
ncbi:MAG: M2 family metallopeptidase [Pseudomonadota bacterium]